MEDAQIIRLYLDRNEDAISHTKDKYGSLCYKISYNILFSEPDCEECVNDTYLAAWDSIPPNVPDILSAFLAKITRRLSISRLRLITAKKRSADTTIPFEELCDCLSAKGEVYEAIEAEELKSIIERFLKAQSNNDRNIFICRYFFCDSIAEISQRFHFSQSKVKTTLFRTRKKLKEYLIKEGVFSE